MEPRNMWLKCSISAGQFSDELAVRAKDHSGAEFSLFVHRDFVDPARVADDAGESSGRVQVDLIDQKAGLCLVQLPGRTFENGSIVTVRADQLESIENSHV